MPSSASSEGAASSDTSPQVLPPPHAAATVAGLFACRCCAALPLPRLPRASCVRSSQEEACDVIKEEEADARLAKLAKINDECAAPDRGYGQVVNFPGCQPFQTI